MLPGLLAHIAVVLLIRLKEKQRKWEKYHTVLYINTSLISFKGGIMPPLHNRRRRLPPLLHIQRPFALGDDGDKGDVAGDVHAGAAHV
jgi:hypothetical protein